MKIKSKILNLACSVAVGSLFANAISAQERVLSFLSRGGRTRRITRRRNRCPPLDILPMPTKLHRLNSANGVVPVHGRDHTRCASTSLFQSSSLASFLLSVSIPTVRLAPDRRSGWAGLLATLHGVKRERRSVMCIRAQLPPATRECQRSPPLLSA